MDVDNQNAYSNGLSDTVDPLLKAKGINVDRQSIASTATDYSSLVSRIGSKTKAVVLTWQVAANAQLFGQQMRQQGKNAIIFGSDGVFDNTKFTIPGAYVSSFAPDIAASPQAASSRSLRQEVRQEGHLRPADLGAMQVVASATPLRVRGGGRQPSADACEHRQDQHDEVAARDAIKFDKSSTTLGGRVLHLPHRERRQVRTVQ